MNPMTPSNQKPKTVTGVSHILAASSYSISGVLRLWKETAFRHEVFLFLAAFLALVAAGASAVEILALCGIFLLLVAFEALNTAIECIVDHLSVEWEEYAKHAKDLGSLAVMCCLLCGGIFVGTVLVFRILQ